MDGYLRGVPSDADPDDGRLYTQGADPVVGGLALRSLLGVGISVALAVLMR